MANLAKILPENAPGEFFVDSTCIDCDTCRQLAPQVFGETDKFSFVRSQPGSTDDERAALRALIACPTGSIGTRGTNQAKQVMDDFPLLVADGVFYCGFNSPKSFGGNSYLLRRPEGNWLVDSPKYLPRLVRKFDEWGGLAGIFLTHRDDVADAEQYARRFAARRVIHRAELEAQPDAEWIIEGDEPTKLAPGLLAIPTPGHTRGHVVLLYQNRFLFTGDHLAWDRNTNRLMAFHDYCWYSWSEQRRSMQRLLDYDFEWILPGHGQRIHLPAGQMRAELAALVERMQWQSERPLSIAN